MNPADALKYAYAQLRATVEWAGDSIGGSMCDHDGHETELDAINDTVETIRELLAPFGNPHRYADGRMVKTHAQIEPGFSTYHIWHPIPTMEEPQSWRGNLMSGHPDVPSPGVYEVTTNPTTQQIHTRVIRIAGAS